MIVDFSMEVTKTTFGNMVKSWGGRGGGEVFVLVGEYDSQNIEYLATDFHSCLPLHTRVMQVPGRDTIMDRVSSRNFILGGEGGSSWITWP